MKPTMPSTIETSAIAGSSRRARRRRQPHRRPHQLLVERAALVLSIGLVAVDDR
jgi:hypothetical protein